MAIVEDEVRNDSEEENDIEVVVEEYDAEQDSDDSDDDDDVVAEALESKVEELEQRIKQDPYNYDDHIELIQALWGLTELEKWRVAFDRLQQLTALKPEHWLMRLQTEATLSHSAENREEMASMFRQATLDCYSIQILSEWCSWSLSDSDAEYTRSQIEEVLIRAGADPLSGKVFWDAKLEFEKAQGDNMSQEDPKYNEQKERVLFCLEEMVSRPLLRAKEAWEPFLELGQIVHGQIYVDKVTKQHNAAMEYLQKITPFEDKLLTLENIDDKFKVYQEYIDTVKDLSKQDKYKDCDNDGILKVLYDRASTECLPCADSLTLLQAWARLVRARSSRASYWRVLAACVRRAPRLHVFWTLQMQQAEHEGKGDASEKTVKEIFETALLKGMESYKHAEALWMSYLEYSRRKTDFTDMKQIELLRNTCRLAWDSLAEIWGDEAIDCEIPLYWARLEYLRMKVPKAGRDIFEEIFKYGENKTMSKYWEALIHLEMSRSPPLSEHKLRDLFRRALRSVTDYPPAVARVWTDYERDFGHLDTLRECADTCDIKLKEWRDSYQAMKEKMTGNKKKNNKMDKKQQKKKFDKKKTEDKPNNKGKRKSEEAGESGGGKRKKDESMDVVVKDKDGDSKGVKRSHDDENGSDEEKETKRQRRESSEDSRPAAREACTLFVSNLEFKVNEQNLRDKLSQFGDIVSLRVKSGVKAFGGSICYCQYKNKESVDEALKQDRSPLDGRPMFLSRYSAKKTKPHFKYETTLEKNKLFVRNLPYETCTKDELTKIFDKYGTLKDIRVVTFKDGKPKGLAYIDYSDEESASRAIAGTDGMLLGERKITVAVSAPPPRAAEPATLGHVKPDTGGMRRTQLSSLIPSSVLHSNPFLPRSLQRPKPSTSKTNGGQTPASGDQTPANGDQTPANGDQAANSDQPEKRPMTNKDFRSMLLGDNK